MTTSITVTRGDKAATKDARTRSSERVQLSRYLQTDENRQDGWAVFSSDDEHKTETRERRPNLAVLKQIKNFLNDDASSNGELEEDFSLAGGNIHVDYPFYDREQEKDSPALPTIQEDGAKRKAKSPISCAKSKSQTIQSEKEPTDLLEDKTEEVANKETTDVKTTVHSVANVEIQPEKETSGLKEDEIEIIEDKELPNDEIMVHSVANVEIQPEKESSGLIEDEIEIIEDKELPNAEVTIPSIVNSEIQPIEETIAPTVKPDKASSEPETKNETDTKVPVSTVSETLKKTATVPSNSIDENTESVKSSLQHGEERPKDASYEMVTESEENATDEQSITSLQETQEINVVAPSDAPFVTDFSDIVAAGLKQNPTTAESSETAALLPDISERRIPSKRKKQAIKETSSTISTEEKSEEQSVDFNSIDIEPMDSLVEIPSQTVDEPSYETLSVPLSNLRDSNAKMTIFRRCVQIVAKKSASRAPKTEEASPIQASDVKNEAAFQTSSNKSNEILCAPEGLGETVAVAIAPFFVSPNPVCVMESTPIPIIEDSALFASAFFYSNTP